MPEYITTGLESILFGISADRAGEVPIIIFLLLEVPKLIGYETYVFCINI
jgi:hypothetical protein